MKSLSDRANAAFDRLNHWLGHGVISQTLRGLETQGLIIPRRSLTRWRKDGWPEERAKALLEFENRLGRQIREDSISPTVSNPGSSKRMSITLNSRELSAVTEECSHLNVRRARIRGRRITPPALIRAISNLYLRYTKELRHLLLRMMELAESRRAYHVDIMIPSELCWIVSLKSIDANEMTSFPIRQVCFNSRRMHSDESAIAITGSGSDQLAIETFVDRTASGLFLAPAFRPTPVSELDEHSHKIIETHFAGAKDRVSTIHPSDYLSIRDAIRRYHANLTKQAVESMDQVALDSMKNFSHKTSHGPSPHL